MIDEASPFTILALLPSNRVVSDCSKIRKRIYRETGLLSPLGLPCIVPLLLMRPAPSQMPDTLIKAAAALPAEYHITGIARGKAYHYLRLREEKALLSWEEQTRKVSKENSEAETIDSLHPGIYLVSSEELRASGKQIPQELEAGIETPESWKRTQLALVHFSCRDTPWWLSSFWEISWKENLYRLRDRR
ncbi:MAG: hypothetical protein K9L68_07365 [Spirochaetales bacterium]|nr:hypothetical protein [Spirochaetales bacterium]MCF7938403.1 hypothetical protein [Spirochaetales bacterium]